jgi:hypothetical protein
VAFLAETGEGLAGANSYITVATLETIGDLFDYDFSDYTDAQLEKKLMRATMVLDAQYRTSYPGERQNEGQGLEWPRSGATYIDGEEIDEDIVPVEIQNATVEMVQILIGTTTVQPVIESQGVLSAERVRIEGAVEEEKKYIIPSGSYRNVYTTVTDALSRITGGTAAHYQLHVIRDGG